LTREHLIEMARANGALAGVAEHVTAARLEAGRPVSEDEALELAKSIVVAFGSTAGVAHGGHTEPNYPHEYVASSESGSRYPGIVPAQATADLERLAAGPHSTGRRGTGGQRPLIPSAADKRRAARAAKQARARLDELRAARLAKSARAELAAAGAGNSDRQREAHVLVRIELRGRRGAKAEAARRMVIHRQTLDDLLKKYDKANKPKKSAT
jgi:hypothetical protein